MAAILLLRFPIFYDRVSFFLLFSLRFGFVVVYIERRIAIDEGEGMGEV